MHSQVMGARQRAGAYAVLASVHLHAEAVQQTVQRGAGHKRGMWAYAVREEGGRDDVRWAVECDSVRIAIRSDGRAVPDGVRQRGAVG